MSSVVAQSVIAAAAVVLSGVGLWAAQNYRRQLRVKLAEQLFKAYISLWEITGQLTMRTAVTMDATKRKTIATAMEDWYFSRGYGLLMPPTTRKLYFAIMQDLSFPLEEAVPESLRKKVLRLPKERHNLVMACACQRYLSLLRTQLKDDLAVYGRISNRRRISDERELLSSCGISPGSPASQRYPSTNRCICGTCDGHIPKVPLDM